MEPTDRPLVTMRQPTLFMPHGAGPCFFIKDLIGPPGTWDGMEAYLRGLHQYFPAPPRAILVVSAHWEADVATVGTAATPGIFHDWYDEGTKPMPPEVTALDWPAPGAPDVAKRVVALLTGAAIAVAEDPERGFDHGVFVPLLLAYPEADIPTVTLSLQRDLDPAHHLAIGRALAPLRDEGIAIIGSGFSFHTMSAQDPTTASRSFDAWLAETIALEPAARAERLLEWEKAPHGRASHRTEEHLAPLFVAAGAADDTPGRVVYQEDLRIGVRVSGYAFG